MNVVAASQTSASDSSLTLLCQSKATLPALLSSTGATRCGQLFFEVAAVPRHTRAGRGAPQRVPEEHLIGSKHRTLEVLFEGLVPQDTERKTPTTSKWWPQRDSNPCFSLERAVSWASRRWGRLRNRTTPGTVGAASNLAGGGGFEPPLPGPEPGVLPLDDPPPCPRRLHTIRERRDRVNEADRRTDLPTRSSGQLVAWSNSSDPETRTDWRVTPSDGVDDETRHVATGSGQTRHQAGLDGIGSPHHDSAAS